MRKNIQDEYDQFKRDHYSVSIKNAVYIGLGLYYIGLIVFAAIMFLFVVPVFSPPIETNEERNEAMYRRMNEKDTIPEWRPEPTDTNR